MSLGLIRYVRNGLTRKLKGREREREAIVVLENPLLGFDLGPKLAQVLRIPYFDARLSSFDKTKLPVGRKVISSSELLQHRALIDLQGSFGDYLLNDLTGGVDLRLEALKLSMQQLAQKKLR